jgi:peptidoglycan hydrolase-like protein with peptidoglycan-binding domain
MKHTIIKDFKGWNRLFEAETAGTAGSAGVAGTTGTAGTSGTAGTAAAAPLTAITGADGALTADDIKKVQAVVYNAPLTDTKSCDGKVGPNTIAKIKEFRTANSITDETLEPTQTTIGPKTLAKIAEKIAAGFTPGAAAGSAGTAGTAGTVFDQRNQNDDKIAMGICDQIVAKFKETEFWKPFKGTFNDDESAAGMAYNNWYTTTIVPLVKTLRAGDPNIAKLEAADKSTRAKLQGGTANDTSSWSIDTLNGPMQYTVNTDF